jgi:hypothetical protein
MWSMSTSPESVVGTNRRLPGDLAMWFFILAELTVFAILILAFAITQVLNPDLFQESRAALDSSIGLALTLSLLTSGLLAALSVEQVRLARPRRGAALLLAALATSCVYVVLKLDPHRISFSPRAAGHGHPRLDGGALPARRLHGGRLCRARIRGALLAHGGYGLGAAVPVGLRTQLTRSRCPLPSF